MIKYLKLKVLLALKWQFRWRPGATLEEGLMIKLNCHFKNILNFFFWIFLSCYSHFFKITSAVPLGLYLIPQDAFSFVFLHFLGIQTVLSRRKSLPVYRRIFTTFKCTEDLSQSFTFSLIFESLLLLLLFVFGSFSSEQRRPIKWRLKRATRATNKHKQGPTLPRGLWSHYRFNPYLCIIITKMPSYFAFIFVRAYSNRVLYSHIWSTRGIMFHQWSLFAFEWWIIRIIGTRE